MSSSLFPEYQSHFNPVIDILHLTIKSMSVHDGLDDRKSKSGALMSMTTVITLDKWLPHICQCVLIKWFAGIDK